MGRALAMTCALSIALAACGGGATGPAASSAAAASGPVTAKDITKAVTFRIGHVASNTSILELDAQDFIKKIGDASGAKITGKSFPSGQLGKQDEMVEQVRLGSLEMVVSSSEFVGVVPEFSVFDLPFAFRDRPEIKKAVEGPLGNALRDAAAKKGLVILGFWENGYRQITNNKRPIKAPDDLKGLKMRTPPNPDRVKMFNLWGANAAPMDFSELFSALQTGVFDGQENPMQNVTSSKFYEVQKYLSMTGHVYTPTYLVASKTWYDAVEPAAQQMMREIAIKNGDASRARGAKFDSDGIDIVKQHGMLVNDDVDKAAFAKAGQPLYDDFQKKFPAILELYHTSVGH